MNRRAFFGTLAAVAAMFGLKLPTAAAKRRDPAKILPPADRLPRRLMRFPDGALVEVKKITTTDFPTSLGTCYVMTVEGSILGRQEAVDHSVWLRGSSTEYAWED